MDRTTPRFFSSVKKKMKGRTKLPTLFDHQKSVLEKFPENREALEAYWNALQLNKPFNKADGKLWERMPRKANVTKHVASWQNSGFLAVVDARRGIANRPPTKLALQQDHALLSYMKSRALRAPAIPLKAGTRTLWRGMVISPAEYDALRTRKYWQDKSESLEL